MTVSLLAWLAENEKRDAIMECRNQSLFIKMREHTEKGWKNIYKSIPLEEIRLARIDVINHTIQGMIEEMEGA